MSAHTPGPWAVEPILDKFNVYLLDESCLCIARDCTEPNARLIAAAPELLSLAKRWTALDGGDWNVERYAREKEELLAETLEVIAKAESA